MTESIYYEPTKDALIAFFYDEDMATEELDAFVRVMRSFADKSIVGVEIAPISEILASPEGRACSAFWDGDGTALAVPIELARKHAGTAFETYAPALEALGARPFRLPDALREKIAGSAR